LLLQSIYTGIQQGTISLAEILPIKNNNTMFAEFSIPYGLNYSLWSANGYPAAI
jgi:hypothetical protein